MEARLVIFARRESPGVLHAPIYGASKRVLDVVLALVGIAVLAILTPFIALAIKLDSPGPVFYRARRLGRGGQPINVLKFRTMDTDAEGIEAALRGEAARAGVEFKAPTDPRITRTGRWLRRSSLDELPQVLSVLAGHMSVVGPRPIYAEEFIGYEDQLAVRNLVKPGLTGYHQVYGRSTVPFATRVVLDVQYVYDRSFWVDLKLIALTVPAVLTGRGAM